MPSRFDSIQFPFIMVLKDRNGTLTLISNKGAKELDSSMDNEELLEAIQDSMDTLEKNSYLVAVRCEAEKETFASSHTGMQQHIPTGVVRFALDVVSDG